MQPATLHERKTDFGRKMKFNSIDNIKMAEILSNRKSINISQVSSDNKSIEFDTNIKMNY